MTSSQAGRTDGPQTLSYGSETINFCLSFSPRKRLSITVEPGGAVIVKAPVESNLQMVLEHLRRRAGWIIRQRDSFADYGPSMPPKKFVSGETHRYLGRQYRLNITCGVTSSVKLVGRHFEIVTPDKSDSQAVKRLMEGWYRKRAEGVLAERIESCLASSWFRSLKSPTWSIRKMKRRWGSCTKDGAILLNLLLIQASPRCIDYVIMHELCHLIIHNHEPQFYRLLSRVMPDWQERKRKLESVTI
ncbi:MAG: M48 family metallopeptidase [Aureliella sp.]